MKRVFLFASILAATFVFSVGLYFYRSYSEAKMRRLLSLPLHAIMQTGPEKRALKTDYLAELIRGFPLEKAKEALLESPVIKEAHVKLVSSGVLLVDYTTRKPYAWLSDYENAALDRAGYPIPFFPFYTPKKMPRLVLGEKSIEWNQPICGERIQLAFQILDFLEKETSFFSIELLDVSKANHPSLGRREIVLVMHEGEGRHYLRFTPKTFKEQWERYCLLKGKLGGGEKVIDLRLAKLAYIKHI